VLSRELTDKRRDWEEHSERVLQAQDRARKVQGLTGWLNEQLTSELHALNR
jgi:hypothetical protein